MTRQRRPHSSPAFPADPRLWQTLLVSLGVHLAVVALFTVAGPARFQRHIRPVYQVDLVSPPVANPRAGRPDARPEPAKAAPRAPVPAPAKPVQVVPKTEPVKIAKPEPAKPAVKKPEAAKTKPAAKETSYEDVVRDIEKKRRAQENREFEQKMRQLAAKANAAAVPHAPVGVPEGKGTEAGSKHDDWLLVKLKEQWSYSPYVGGGRTDLEAVFLLHFDAKGRFVDYKIKHGSGNRQFDESVVRALLKLFKDQALPNPPKRPSEFEVAFNLKDLKR